MKRTLVVIFSAAIVALTVAALGNDDPKAGQAFCCAPTMVAISAPGTFTVGSPAEDPWREGTEATASITVDYAWRVAESEITKRQYKALMHEAASFFAECDDCPQDARSWYQATGYADALSSVQGLQQCYGGCFASCQTSQTVDEPCFDACYPSTAPATLSCTGYRLPTAAEFEWMSRDGDVYPAGGIDNDQLDIQEACQPDTTIVDDVVYCYNTHNVTTGMPGFCQPYPSLDAGNDPYACVTPLPVDTKPANGLGVRGIRGNLYEWTHSNWCGTSWATTNPTGDECVNDPVLKEKRGGSYLENSRHQRYPFRSYDLRTRKEKNIGFRVVLNGSGS